MIRAFRKPDAKTIRYASLSVVFGMLFLWLMAGQPSAFADGAINVPDIKIGVLAFRGVGTAQQRWQPLAEYLSEKIPEHTFSIVGLELDALRQAVQAQQMDFVLTNTGSYIEFEAKYNVTRIATLVNRINQQDVTKFGAVIFTRSNRSDINSMSDLRRKSFAAVHRDAFGGFQMAWREFHRAGIDPFKAFAKVAFLGWPQDEIVFRVLSGEFDAGTVRTGVLERLVKEKRIQPGSYQVINEKRVDDFPRHLSTQLYPEWPIAKAVHTSKVLARNVAIALLNMPADGYYAKQMRIGGWTAPLSYQAVHELMKDLKVGPYHDFGKIDFMLLVRKYWHWVGVSLLFAIILIGLLLSMLRLNHRLTLSKQQLEQEIEQRQRVEQERLALLNQLEQKNTNLIEDKKQYLALINELEMAQQRLLQKFDMSAISELAQALLAELKENNHGLSSQLRQLQACLTEWFDLDQQIQALSPTLRQPQAEEVLRQNEKLQMSVEHKQNELLAATRACHAAMRRIEELAHDIHALSSDDQFSRWCRLDLHTILNPILDWIEQQHPQYPRFNRDLNPLPSLDCASEPLQHALQTLLMHIQQSNGVDLSILVRTGCSPDGMIWIEASNSEQRLDAGVWGHCLSVHSALENQLVAPGDALLSALYTIEKHHGLVRVAMHDGIWCRTRILLPVKQHECVHDGMDAAASA